MNSKYNIAFIGGDKRLAHMIPLFEKKGYHTNSFGLIESSTEEGKDMAQMIKKADILVCGIPMIKNGYINILDEEKKCSEREFLDILSKNQKIFGGLLPTEFRKKCEEKGVYCYDFMNNEEVSIFNAIATAEGAIMEALLHKETNLHKSNVLVLGYGRCGKVLADKLKGLSVNVTVLSRVETELATAGALGFESVTFSGLKRKIGQYEYFFNTIPDIVLNEKLIHSMQKDALIIDIASGKGGVDYEAVIGSNVKALHCLGLPGKYASKTSALPLFEMVVKVMKQSVQP